MNVGPRAKEYIRERLQEEKLARAEDIWADARKANVTRAAFESIKPLVAEIRQELYGDGKEEPPPPSLEEFIDTRLRINILADARSLWREAKAEGIITALTFADFEEVMEEIQLGIHRNEPPPSKLNGAQKRPVVEETTAAEPDDPATEPDPEPAGDDGWEPEEEDAEAGCPEEATEAPPTVEGPGPLQVCIVCGCNDLRACADRDGHPCRWSFKTKSGPICSACADEMVPLGGTASPGEPPDAYDLAEQQPVSVTVANPELGSLEALFYPDRVELRATLPVAEGKAMVKEVHRAIQPDVWE